MVNEADYSSMQLELFDKCEYPPGGYILDSIFLKMCPEHSQAIREWTFAQSLSQLQTPKFQYLEVGNGQMHDWLEADDVMLGGGFSMLNILEAPKETSSFPKEGEGYGLSQILEKSTDVPKKYFLSAKACRGIINRSERRNKTLPPILKKALEMQAGITHDEVSIVGGQMYDITHADDVVRETDKSPTLNARMGTGGNQVPILTESIPEAVVMGHDERSAKFNTEITDPLTACDYKQPQIVAQMSTTGGAERLRNRKRTDEPTDDDGQSGSVELYARPDCYYATSCDGRSTIGSLCAHDGRGFNGQDVNQGKLIIQYESHNDN